MSSIWPDTRLTDLLGISHPLVLAGMKGEATPALAAAVSNAGGLGSVGCGVPSAEELDHVCDTMKARTNAPFALNLWVLAEVPAESLIVAPDVKARLRRWYGALGAGDVTDAVSAPPSGLADAVVEVLLARRPPVVSFHFGFPGAGVVDRLKAAGIRLICSATTVAEAVALDRAGVDAVIAQGWEAGGHRGSHVPGLPGDGVGTMALVPQIVDAVRVPVIAAGGISDGRGIAAAFALGAAGVQMGSAFLRCPEAGTDPATRTLLGRARDTDTMVTDAVSGRSARAVRSPYAEDMADLAGRLPPYPSMYALSDPILAAGAGRSDAAVAAFPLFGQAAGLARELPAAEVFVMLVAEAQQCLRRLGPAKVADPG